MAQLKTRPRKTVDDYMRLPEGVRAELIDGELLMSPSPKPRHQRIIGNLYVALRAFIEDQGLGRVFVAPLDVHLPSGNIVQPDLVVVLKAHERIIQDWVRGVPDLLVEVVSPENPERDRLVKRDLYAGNGVKEYWIADGEARAIEVLRLSKGRYEPHGYFEVGDALSPALLPGLSLQLEPLLR
jgi:Uma2 family endonuclease